MKTKLLTIMTHTKGKDSTDAGEAKMEVNIGDWMMAKEDLKVMVDGHTRYQGRGATIKAGTGCKFDRTNHWDKCFFIEEGTGVEFYMDMHPDHIPKYFEPYKYDS